MACVSLDGNVVVKVHETDYTMPKASNDERLGSALVKAIKAYDAATVDGKALSTYLFHKLMPKINFNNLFTEDEIIKLTELVDLTKLKNAVIARHSNIKTGD